MSVDHKPENNDVVVVYVTVPTVEAAAAIGDALVAERLSACVNILPGMTSIYRWQGEMHHDQEAVMIVKTTARQAEAVVAAVKRRHTYANPAILVIPVIGGSADFLAWIRSETSACRTSK